VAISTHLDKYLVERYFKRVHPAVLLVFTGVTNLVALPFIVALRPGVLDLGIDAIALMMLSGVLLMGAALFYLQALQSEEASVVAPFFQAAPLFGFALGYAVLGERLSGLQLLGAALTVAGAAIAATRSGSFGRPFNARLVMLMLACAFTVALSSLIFKMFTLRDEFWTTTFWLFIGEAAFGGAVLAVGSVRRQVISILRTNTAAVVGINGANEVINLVGGLGTRYALLLAPLSLVQAIGSTTTVFTFLLGIALSLFVPTLGREDLSGRELLRKGAAAVLVALGVALITLSAAPSVPEIGKHMKCSACGSKKIDASPSSTPAASWCGPRHQEVEPAEHHGAHVLGGLLGATRRFAHALPGGAGLQTRAVLPAQQRR